ncbi:hypothetical protein [Halalkalibacter alkaliphilus]|uniref:Uncharacterized protein n=1 Tax=Halalkalibacter alkaliphilus TaxID=2917993 RepID=A0A9X2CSG1_9BACI|nr:hypothetical protein [Halalkalibacter alkaliphilus]MCL7747331.1 hypothetical protein [Halalkalibacter alkaliphilus]
MEKAKVMFWILLYSIETKEFKNAIISEDPNESIERIADKYEENHPEFRVIHIGMGEHPPKTYRSLAYVN